MIRDTPMLRKFLLLISTALAALFVGWILWIFGVFDLIFQDDKNAAESEYSLSDLPFEYVVDAVWLDDQKLLLTIGENLTEYDEYTRDVIVYDWLKQQTLISYNDVLGISDYSGYNCISKHGVSLTAKFTKDGSSFYQQMQFPDPQDPETYTKHDLSFKFQEFNWKLNRLDCHPFKFQRNTPETHVSEAGDILEEYGNRITNSPKRLTSDGITKTYINPNGNIIIKGQMPLTGEFDNTSFVINPPKTKLQGSLVSQSISKNHSYLISERISDLSQNPSKFVNTAWHVSNNLELVKEYNIPAGPWIYNLGYRSCFSCGCECYDAMDLKLSGDSIFALISGKGVRQKHKGVYRLNQDQKWEHILQGADTRAFAINENQCLIATGGHNPKVTDICSAKP